MLGLDLVPRVEWEPVNVNTLSPVDLFFLHYRSSASTNASSVKRTLPSNVQFLVAIVGCIMFLIQHSYLHFSNALFFALYLLSSCDFTLFISLIVFLQVYTFPAFWVAVSLSGWNSRPIQFADQTSYCLFCVILSMFIGACLVMYCYSACDRGAEYCNELVCLCVCLSVIISWNYTSDFHQIFYACYLWLWIGPPLAA